MACSLMQMGGYTYLEFIRGLSKRVEGEWDAVRADLEAIRTALLSRWVITFLQGPITLCDLP